VIARPIGHVASIPVKLNLAKQAAVRAFPY
jgi:hypothetical protein